MQPFHIQPGLVYLTIGTVEQIKYLLLPKNLEFKLLYQPKTNELRQELEYVDPFSYTEEGIIIVPKEFKATGLIKKRKVKKKEGEEEEEGYLIPSDQYLKVSPFKYCFLLLMNALGEYTAEAQAARKKLEGGIFVSLDLRNYIPESVPPGLDNAVKSFYSLYPLSLEDKIQKGIELETLDTTEDIHTQYIEGLLSIEGIRQWNNFNSAELFKYFLNTNYKNIPLLVYSRAWCLSPYLQPIISFLQNNYAENPSAYLYRFAFWVYCATKYWSRAGEEGLGFYKERYQGNIVRTWVFHPSTIARKKWLEITVHAPANKVKPKLK